MTKASHSPKFSINPDSPVPLYYQIRENLRELIVAQEFAPEMPIPSERELSEAYGVNRLTVRQAIADLVNAGLLRRQRGIGTFVAPQKITQTMPGLLGFTERMQRAGRKPFTKVLSAAVELPPGSAARALKLSAGAQTVKLVRLRYVDDSPFMIETSYLPLKLVPDLADQDLENNSLYRLLSSRYNLQMVEATEVLEPVLLTAYEAELLGSEPGRPALLVEGTIYDAANQPIEFTKSLVRGDKARFLFTLHRTGGSA